MCARGRRGLETAAHHPRQRCPHNCAHMSRKESRVVRGCEHGGRSRSGPLADAKPCSGSQVAHDSCAYSWRYARALTRRTVQHGERMAGGRADGMCVRGGRAGEGACTRCVVDLCLPIVPSVGARGVLASARSGEHARQHASRPCRWVSADCWRRIGARTRRTALGRVG